MAESVVKPLQKLELPQSILATESQQPGAIAIPDEKSSEQDPWEALRKIYNMVYRKTEAIPVQVLQPEIEKLKDVKRDSEFWNIINMGFMGGKSELFFDALKKYHAYQILFPPTTEESRQHQEKNDTWFVERLGRMDESNQFFLSSRKYPKQTYLLEYSMILLLVKELSHPTQAEVERVKQAYQIPYTPSKLMIEVNYAEKRGKEKAAEVAQASVLRPV